MGEMTDEEHNRPNLPDVRKWRVDTDGCFGSWEESGS